MPLEPRSLEDLLSHRFDMLIDVRSPAEFGADHVPGALNLPVLSDAERAHVGRIYVQEDAFRARKIGAALVARNAARHLEGPLAEMPGGWRPLVQCWRGGQRSESFASILRQIGWRAETVSGGYRSWRRLVVAALYTAPWPVPVILLDGNTGTAKTEILGRLARRGVQALDLERLAAHSGSVFGAVGGPQPGQRAFETAIAQRLAGLDRSRPVVVEAESSKVGARLIPPALWAAMQAAPRIELAAPAAERAVYLVRAYRDILADRERLAAALGGLRRLQGAEAVTAWQALAARRDDLPLAIDLIVRHYDPRYARHRRAAPAPAATLTAERLDPAGLETLAAQVAAAVAALAARVEA